MISSHATRAASGILTLDALSRSLTFSTFVSPTMVDPSKSRVSVQAIAKVATDMSQSAASFARRSVVASVFSLTNRFDIVSPR